MIKNKKLFELINKLQDDYHFAECTYFKRNKNNTVDITIMYKQPDCLDFELCLKSRFHPLKIEVSTVQYLGQKEPHMKFELFDVLTDIYDHNLER